MGIRMSQEIMVFNSDRSKLLIHAIVNFVLWRERCRRIFHEVEKEIDMLIEEVIQQKADWAGI